jgi:AbrB family looped-hinge helix DNA binding protein
MRPETSTVTRKGQVTIPVRLRRAFDLEEGSHIRFSQDGDRIIIEPVIEDVEAAFGLISIDESVSSRQIKETIRSRSGK